METSNSNVDAKGKRGVRDINAQHRTLSDQYDEVEAILVLLNQWSDKLTAAADMVVQSYGIPKD